MFRSVWRLMMAFPADDGDERVLVQNIHIAPSDIQQLPAEPVYVVYKRRWYILAVVAVLNISNAMLWLSYSPIANHTTSYYNIGAMKVNWLSLVYPIAAIPIGFAAVWILDTFGIRFGIVGGSWLNLVGAGLRVLSSTSVVPDDYKYYALIGGQSVAAVAQPFLLFVPTKVAALWFQGDQRATANMLTSMSNPLGILVANIVSPVIVKGASDIPFLNEIYVIPAGVGALTASIGICSSVPPTPPSPSAAETSQPFLQGIKEMLKEKAYWILMFSFGAGVGLFTALSTLLEQILCPRGYPDSYAGLCGALLIGVGIVGAAIAGIIVDKTKKFEEVTKVCYGLAAISSVFFAIIANYEDQEGLIAFSVSLFGLFGFAIYPLCLELSVECAYPVAEATTAGFLLMSGQVLSVALIVLMPLMARTDELPHQVCESIGVAGITPMSYTYANTIFATLACFSAIGFILFFKSPYKRLQAEQQVAAERILNFNTSRQQGINS